MKKKRLLVGASVVVVVADVVVVIVDVVVGVVVGRDAKLDDPSSTSSSSFPNYDESLRFTKLTPILVWQQTRPTSS